MSATQLKKEIKLHLADKIYYQKDGGQENSYFYYEEFLNHLIDTKRNFVNHIILVSSLHEPIEIYPELLIEACSKYGDVLFPQNNDSPKTNDLIAKFSIKISALCLNYLQRGEIITPGLSQDNSYALIQRLLNSPIGYTDENGLHHVKYKDFIMNLIRVDTEVNGDLKKELLNDYNNKSTDYRKSPSHLVMHMFENMYGDIQSPLQVDSLFFPSYKRDFPLLFSSFTTRKSMDSLYETYKLKTNIEKLIDKKTESKETPKLLAIVVIILAIIGLLSLFK